jgi:TRAP-type C4-dicarboxylate transport system permease small subunit
MEALDRINTFLNRVLIFFAGIAVLGLMILATGNICLRLFQMPYRGAYELVSFLGAVVIAFALGYTQRRKTHIVVDILSDAFPGRVKRIIDGISYFVTMIFFGILSWQVLKWGLRIARSGEVSETLKIIYHPFIFCVGVGLALLSFTLIVDFLKTVLKKEG